MLELRMLLIKTKAKAMRCTLFLQDKYRVLKNINEAEILNSFFDTPIHASLYFQYE